MALSVKVCAACRSPNLTTTLGDGVSTAPPTSRFQHVLSHRAISNDIYVVTFSSCNCLVCNKLSDTREVRTPPPPSASHRYRLGACLAERETFPLLLIFLLIPLLPRLPLLQLLSSVFQLSTPLKPCTPYDQQTMGSTLQSSSIIITIIYQYYKRFRSQRQLRSFDLFFLTTYILTR